MNVLEEYKNTYVKHMVDFVMNSNMNMDEKTAALDMLHDIDGQCEFKTYKVKITETFISHYDIEAKTQKEAEEKARELYYKFVEHLTPDDLEVKCVN